jgi:hypothetical protein
MHGIYLLVLVVLCSSSSCFASKRYHREPTADYAFSVLRSHPSSSKDPSWEVTFLRQSTIPTDHLNTHGELQNVMAQVHAIQLNGKPVQDLFLKDSDLRVGETVELICYPKAWTQERFLKETRLLDYPGFHIESDYESRLIVQHPVLRDPSLSLHLRASQASTEAEIRDLEDAYQEIIENYLVRDPVIRDGKQLVPKRHGPATILFKELPDNDMEYYLTSWDKDYALVHVNDPNYAHIINSELSKAAAFDFGYYETLLRARRALADPTAWNSGNQIHEYKMLLKENRMGNELKQASADWDLAKLAWNLFQDPFLANAGEIHTQYMALLARRKAEFYLPAYNRGLSLSRKAVSLLTTLQGRMDLEVEKKLMQDYASMMGFVDLRLERSFKADWKTTIKARKALLTPLDSGSKSDQKDYIKMLERRGRTVFASESERLFTQVTVLTRQILDLSQPLETSHVLSQIQALSDLKYDDCVAKLENLRQHRSALKSLVTNGHHDQARTKYKEMLEVSKVGFLDRKKYSSAIDKKQIDIARDSENPVRDPLIGVPVSEARPQLGVPVQRPAVGIVHAIGRL